MKKFVLSLRLVKNHVRPDTPAALDSNGRQWESITQDDYPGQKCSICDQDIDEGWIRLVPTMTGKDFPYLVCKRHVSMNGKPVTKYRSIDD